MKTIIFIIISSLLLSSCSSYSQIDKEKFMSIYRVTKELEGANKVGLSYDQLVQLVQKLASEIALAKDRASTDEERQVLTLYEGVLECYQDGIKIWGIFNEYRSKNDLLEQLDMMSSVVKPLGPFLEKYGIEQNQKYTLEGFGTMLQTATSNSLKMANEKSNEINEVILGKRNIKDVSSG